MRCVVDMPGVGRISRKAPRQVSAYPHGGPARLPGRPARLAALQHRPDPGHRPGEQDPDPLAPVPRRPELRARRRHRPHRQDHAPARPGRPDGRHLPAADEPAAHRPGVPPPARPRDLPWRPGPDPPGVPRGPGGPTGQSGPRPQRVVLWNTRYLDAAVAGLRAEGHDIKDEDVARLSPLKDRGGRLGRLGKWLDEVKRNPD